jgi:hypothetical protein
LIVAPGAGSFHARVVTERISSGGTGLIKYGVFPLVIVVALAASIVEVLYTTDAYGYATLVIIALVAAWMGPWVYRCKDVFATEAGLRVGDPDGAEIPYREITAVSRFGLSNPEVIVVRLASGGKLVFFAKWHAGFRSEARDLVEQLRARAKLTA